LRRTLPAAWVEAWSRADGIVRAPEGTGTARESLLICFLRNKAFALADHIIKVSACGACFNALSRHGRYRLKG
jgi:hypothetical protein